MLRWSNSWEFGTSGMVRSWVSEIGLGAMGWGGICATGGGMACVAAVVWRQGGGYGASLIRVALMHGSSPCNEKWDNKWKSVKPFLLSENLPSDVIQVELQWIKVVIRMQFANGLYMVRNLGSITKERAGKGREGQDDAFWMCHSCRFSSPAMALQLRW